MTARSRSKLVVFSHPFELKGVDRILPPGDYRVVTDEVLIEELSFPVYRRISTMIFLPGQGRQASSLEMMTIDPRDLEAAQDRDQYNESTTRGNANRQATKPSISISLAAKIPSSLARPVSAISAAFASAASADASTGCGSMPMSRKLPDTLGSLPVSCPS
jgi:hypothetical protein